ncbi:glycosyltransferase [candidate division KSB1 bacterium]|nr:glycosyltransferase [candidate division KSB1 bacterium]
MTTQKLPTISVVIPTLNDEAQLRELLAELQKLTFQPDEIIIVDANSSDLTSEVVKENKSKLILSEVKGRGQQIKIAVENARSDIVLILHADIGIEDEIIHLVSKQMAETNVPGGAIGSRFDCETEKMKPIENLNRWRASVLGLSFGDQGQFFWREKAIKGKWIQNLPIMEDLELSLQMRKNGKPLWLNGGIVSSTRNWDRKNRFFNSMKLVSFIICYLIMRHFNKQFITQKIYQWYYK